MESSFVALPSALIPKPMSGPRERTVVVRSNIDEVAVFLKEGEDEWKRIRDRAAEKVTPIRLVSYSMTIR